MVCSVYGFLTGLSRTCSITTLTAVAIQRYLVISLPIGKAPTRKWAYFMALLIWLYSAVLASLPFFGAGKYVPVGYLTSCCLDFLSDNMATRILILVFFVGTWMVPMIIMVYCYSSIIRAVIHVRLNNVTYPPSNYNHNDHSVGINQHNVEVEIAKTISCLFGTWLLSWTPYAVVALIGLSGHGHLLTPLNVLLPALFEKLSTCVNPFINILTQPLIQMELYRRLQLISAPPFTNTSVSAEAYTNKADDPVITVNHDQLEVEIWFLRQHHQSMMLDPRDSNWRPSVDDPSVQDHNQQMEEGEKYYYYYETTV